MDFDKSKFDAFYKACGEIGSTLFELGIAGDRSIYYPDVLSVDLNTVSKNFKLKTSLLEEEAKRLWTYNFCDSKGYNQEKHLKTFLKENGVKFEEHWFKLINRDHFIVAYEKTAVALFRSLNYYKGYLPPSVLDYFLYPIDKVMERGAAHKINFMKEFKGCFALEDNTVIFSETLPHDISSTLRGRKASGDTKLDFMIPLTHPRFGKFILCFMYVNITDSFLESR